MRLPTGWRRAASWATQSSNTASADEIRLSAGSRSRVGRRPLYLPSVVAGEVLDATLLVTQLPLDLVEPVGMCLDDAARQAVVEEQVALAAGDRGGDGLAGVDSGGDVGDLLAQRPEAVEHCLLADEVGGEQSDDRLVLDAREAGRLLHPFGRAHRGPCR